MVEAQWIHDGCMRVLHNGYRSGYLVRDVEDQGEPLRHLEEATLHNPESASTRGTYLDYRPAVPRC